MADLHSLVLNLINPIDATVSGAEWLEADGLGGFASGTVSGIRSRRYHALLLTATTPPEGRVVLVNGFDAWVETPDGTFSLSSQHYAPDVIHPDGASRIEAFAFEPWPKWRFRLTNEIVVEQELFVRPGESAIFLSWRIAPVVAGIKLFVRPFFTGRDFHSTHRENGAFRFTPRQEGECYIWHPYDGLPAVITFSNGHYQQDPVWYRNFLYREEQARGLDAIEDCAAPGIFAFDLSSKPAVLMFGAVAGSDDPGSVGVGQLNAQPESPPPATESIEARYLHVRTMEQDRRKSFASPLERAADAFLVRRGECKTIIAGHPWFGDWGRDSFIAIRGLCLATGRLEEAREILLGWSSVVSEGMLPNRFPDRGAQPEYNSVDASLWYIIAVGDYLSAVETNPRLTADCHTEKLRAAVEAILTGYHDGTRFGIRADSDGLLAAGEPGYQLTWMDARVDGREITPRIGKPVEVQALWLNALAIGARFSPRWQPIFEQGSASFETRFWNNEGGYLYDVVDCNHEPGTVDQVFRPNQIFAVGGLPLVLLSPEHAR